MPLTLDRWIGGHARFSPDKPALVFRGRALTYRGLAERIDRAAGVLGALGLRRGDRLAYYGMNHPDQFVLLFAAARLGLLLVPLNWRLALPELQFIVADCAPKALCFDGHFAEPAQALCAIRPGCRALAVGVWDSEPPVAGLERARDAGAAGGSDPAAGGGAVVPADPDDPLLIVYTSGTTGRPKGAVLTQRAVRCNAQMSQHMYDMTAADHVLNILPLFHVGGLNIQPLPALSLGATVTLHEKFEPQPALEALERDGVTLVNLVPTILQALQALPRWDRADLGTLRAISIGSTDVPLDLIERVHAQRSGVPLIQVYGATETGPVAIYQRIGQARATAGSIGRCGLYCEARLVDAGGRDVAEGEDGEIWLRGDNLLSRYWNNPQATAAALTDGWFRTGDIARRDADGNYWFADRIKHVIISGGENIYPAELERILRRVPGVREAAVAGRNDPRWGKVPVAVVARDDPKLDRDAVLAAFAGRLARFKQPRDVVFVDALPRNAMGKVQVDELAGLV